MCRVAERLRQLERTWKESGAVEDEARYLRERMRRGQLDLPRLEIAALFEHPAALRVLEQCERETLTTRETAELFGVPQGRVRGWKARGCPHRKQGRRLAFCPSELSPWVDADWVGFLATARTCSRWDPSHQATIRMALAASEQVVPAWQAAYPDDVRAGKALQAVRAWLACPCAKHEAQAAIARQVLDATLRPPQPDAVTWPAAAPLSALRALDCMLAATELRGERSNLAAFACDHALACLLHQHSDGWNASAREQAPHHRSVWERVGQALVPWALDYGDPLLGEPFEFPTQAAPLERPDQVAARQRSAVQALAELNDTEYALATRPRERLEPDAADDPFAFHDMERWHWLEFASYLRVRGRKRAPVLSLSVPARGLPLSDDHVARIGELTTLVSLSLNAKVSRHAAEHLRRLTALEVLRLAKTPLTGPHLDVLGELPALRQLALGFCSLEEPGLLGALPQRLTALSLQAEGVDDDALADLRRLDRLEALELSHQAGITARGLEHLSGLPSLKHVELEGSPATTAGGLAALAELPGLETLLLSWCAETVDDAGVAHLARCRTLTRLDLKGCQQLSDDCLDPLLECRSLKHLDLKGCRGVKADAVKWFRTMRPGVTVRRR